VPTRHRTRLCPAMALRTAMSSSPRKPSNTNPQGTASRLWRALLIRDKAQVFGEVEARSWEAAEAAALRRLNLSPQQRNRLVLQERR